MVGCRLGCLAGGRAVSLDDWLEGLRRWLAGREAVFLDVRLVVEVCAWTVGRSSGCQFLAQTVCLDGWLAVGVVCFDDQGALTLSAWTAGWWSDCLLE